ncbi:MAG: hypothetical protein U1A27_11375 [Phycisphaerae bacterium]
MPRIARWLEALCPQKQLLRDPTHVGLRQTMRLRRKDGSHVWVETAYTVIRDVDDNGALTLGVMRYWGEAREQAREVLATLEDHRREAERPRGELAGRYGFGSLTGRRHAAGAGAASRPRPSPTCRC